MVVEMKRNLSKNDFDSPNSSINNDRRARQRCFGLLVLISRPQVRQIHLLERMILIMMFAI